MPDYNKKIDKTKVKQEQFTNLTTFAHLCSNYKICCKIRECNQKQKIVQGEQTTRDSVSKGR